MDQRFVSCFIVVTGLLAAAAYLSTQALAQRSVVLAMLSAVAGVLGILGFIALARVVVLAERHRKQR